MSADLCLLGCERAKGSVNSGVGREGDALIPSGPACRTLTLTSLLRSGELLHPPSPIAIHSDAEWSLQGLVQGPAHPSRTASQPDLEGPEGGWSEGLCVTMLP